MRIIPAILFAATVFASNAVSAQDGKSKKAKTEAQESDDLMDMLDEDGQGSLVRKKAYTTATFKTSRLVNGHSIENTAKGVLDFKVNHRFGALDGGFSNFFGLDNANTMIGFDYGVTDWLTLGFSRSTYEKEYLGYVKAKILRQTENGDMPISLSYYGNTSVQGMAAPTLPAGQEYHFSNRMFYVNQLLLARKFNQWLSVQLMPTHIHYNLVPTTAEPNDIFALGVGGRVKVSNRVSINAEYYYRFTELNGYSNSLSIGCDIETGGHVFQLMLTNATAMTERAFIGQTVNQWGDGGIHFGFNISRVFTIVKPKEFK